MSTKMKITLSLKIWVVIYPSITAVLYFLGEPLASLPLLVRTLVLTVVLVPWMIFGGIPLLEIIIKKLNPSSTELNKS